jgi:hypothetical protein
VTQTKQPPANPGRFSAAPFIWEVHGLAATPVHVSEDRYKSMGAAYEAGQARLAEFMPTKCMRRRDMDDFAEPVLTHGSEMSIAL